MLTKFCPGCGLETPSQSHLATCDGKPIASAKPQKVSLIFANGNSLIVSTKVGVEITNKREEPYFFKMESVTGELVFVNPDHVVSMVLEDL